MTAITPPIKQEGQSTKLFTYAKKKPINDPVKHITLQAKGRITSYLHNSHRPLLS